MLRIVSFYLLFFTSTIFLFMSPGPIFEYSSFLFYAMSGMAVLVTGAFLHFYRNTFIYVLQGRAVNIEEVSASSLGKWLTKASPHFTRILTALLPLTAGVAAIANTMNFWFFNSKIIGYASVSILALHGALVVALLTTTVVFTFARTSNNRKEHLTKKVA